MASPFFAIRTVAKKKMEQASSPADVGDALLDELTALIARISARDMPAPAPTASPPVDVNSQRPRPLRSSDNARSIRARTNTRPRTRMPRQAQPQSTTVDLDQSATSVAIDNVQVDTSLQSRPLNLREIADFLTVSEDVARYLLREKKIRGFKAGGQWRSMPQALCEYVIEQLSKS